MTMRVVSMDITRMNLILMNVDPLAYKNHHVRDMLFQHNFIGFPIDVLCMEIFCRQRQFLDGKFYKNSISYPQDPLVLLTVIVGNEEVRKFINLVSSSLSLLVI